MDGLGIFAPKTNFAAKIILPGELDSKDMTVTITQEDLYVIVGIKKQAEGKMTGDLYKIKKIETIAALFDVINKGIAKVQDDFEEE